MNRVAKIANMKYSNFANPHGLSNVNNYSAAEDVCRLSIFAMKN